MIYADNAATTKMSPVALAAMLPALEDNYGNPSSLHSVGQHAAELRITVSVRAYLFRAVRNRALNRLRDDRFSYIPFEELGEVFASPESLQIETDEITQLVAEAVSQLPGRCRDIFLKSRNAQLSNAEIAAEMHISVKTVEAQMSKALRRLRGLLHKE